MRWWQGGDLNLGQPSKCDGGVTACGGLFRRREIWFPTWKCALALAGLLLVVLAGIKILLHPYLAVTERVECKTLIVEGWIPAVSIGGVVGEFRSGGYDRILTVGGPIEGLPAGMGGVRTHAEACAAALVEAGVDKAKVGVVSAGRQRRARTWASAKALKEHFKGSPEPFNLVTVGVHARRSRMLFQEAVGEKVRVGVVSLNSEEFGGADWWSSSAGVKAVVGEAWTLVFYRLLLIEESLKGMD